MTDTAKIWLIVGVIAVGLLLFACIITIACIAIIGTSEENGVLETPSVEAPVAPDVETATPETPGPAAGAALANFTRVGAGANYARVSAIFGIPGELTARPALAAYKTGIYARRATGGFGNAAVSFSNGKVTGKAQIGPP